MNGVLEVEDLTVSLGESELFRRLDFSVARGSALAIIGPNGVGKTVLLRALIGALPYKGKIRWAANTRLGYVPQKLDLDRDLPVNGRDFLNAKAALVNVKGEEIMRALRSVGLEEAQLSQPIDSMSGGQFQRLLVAFALLGKPNVLLLDEPAAGVDEPGQEQMNEVIHRMQSVEGMTVLLVSHDLSVVYRYADQVLCLGRGQNACFGAPREMLTPQMLYDIYGSPVSFHVHDAA